MASPSPNIIEVAGSSKMVFSARLTSITASQMTIFREYKAIQKFGV
jgi:hypothetical protein